jgi:hypothetical protein
MTIRDLDAEEFEEKKRFATRDLFDQVFTDYKTYPTELAEIQNLELLVRERVSQIVARTGIIDRTAAANLFAVSNETAEVLSFITPEAIQIINEFNPTYEDISYDGGGGYGGDGGGGDGGGA